MKKFTVHRLCLECLSDLLRYLGRINLVDSTLDSEHIVISAVRRDFGVIGNYYKGNVVLREEHLRIIIDHYGFSTESGEVFHYYGIYLSLINVSYHFLKCRAFKVCSCVSIVSIEIHYFYVVCLAILLCDSDLRFDGYACSVIDIVIG